MLNRKSSNDGEENLEEIMSIAEDKIEKYAWVSRNNNKDFNSCHHKNGAGKISR